MEKLVFIFLGLNFDTHLCGKWTFRSYWSSKNVGIEMILNKVTFFLFFDVLFNFKVVIKTNILFSKLCIGILLGLKLSSIHGYLKNIGAVTIKRIGGFFKTFQSFVIRVHIERHMKISIGSSKFIKSSGIKTTFPDF